MRKLKEVFTPNRVAAIGGILAAAAAFITTLETSLVPGSPATEPLAKAGVMLSAVITIWRIVEKFMDGAQNWDSLMQAGVPKTAGMTVVQAPALLPPPAPPAPLPPPMPAPSEQLGADRMQGFPDSTDNPAAPT